MKGKIILLGLGYALGSVISSVYGSDKNSKFRKKLKEAQDAGEDTKMMILDHVTKTHKSFFHELNEKYMTEENKAYLAEQSGNLKAIVKEYKLEGEKLIAEIKDKPEESFELISEKLQNLYEAKKGQLDDLSEDAPEDVKKLKKSLLARYEKFKKSMKS